MTDAAIQEWIDQAADRFEAAWREVGSPTIESFLPPISDGRRFALLCELVKLDIEYRQQLGNIPSLDSYLADYPELADSEHRVAEELVKHYQRITQNADEVPLDCPHCGNPIRIIKDSAPQVTCENCGSTFRLNAQRHLAQAVAAPKNLAHFEILELLGEGSFGAVYRGRDTQLDRIVAIKIPRDGNFATEAERERFLREARNAAQLDHPAIVSTHEIGHEGSLSYIVSEYIEGETLAARIKRQRPAPREAAELVRKIADALQYAHEKKLIHRDIKPSNVLLDTDGQPHLTDFGLARREGAEILITLQGQILGTPAYMSPEQARGDASQLDPRSDIYSLGIVLYEMLTGERPFRGTTRMLLYQVLNDDPRPPRRLNDRVPRDLETICLKCIEKSASRRYDTAEDLASDIDRFFQGRPIEARPTSNFERAWRWCNRNRLVASLMFTIMGLMAAVTVVSVYASITTKNALDSANIAKTEEEKQRVEAQRQTAEAQRQRDEAIRQRDIADHHLYLAKLSPVRGAWEARDSDKIGRLLNELRPRDDESDNRGWEWHFLRTACERPRRALPRLHAFGDSASQVRWSPDGTKLAVLANDKTLEVWQAPFESPTLRVFPQPNYLTVNDFCWSPDSRRIATIESTGKMRIHSSDNPPMEWNAWQLSNQPLVACNWSHDGHTLAVSDENGDCFTINPGTGKRIATFSNSKAKKVGVAWNSDDSELATVELGNGRLQFWNVKDVVVVAELPIVARDFSAQSVIASPRAKLLAVISDWNHVKIFNWSTHELQMDIGRLDRSFLSACWSPNDVRLCVADYQAFRVVNVDDGKDVLFVQADPSQVRDVSWSPDGKQLAVGGGNSTMLWNMTKIDLGEPHPFIDFSHDDYDWLAAEGKLVSSTLAKVNIYDPISKQWTKSLHSDRSIRLVKLSPDERRVAAIRNINESKTQDLCVWDIDSGELLVHEELTANCIEWSRDSRVIAIGSVNELKVLDTTENKWLAEVVIGNGLNYVESVAWQPTGKQLAVAAGGVVIIDSETWKPQAKLTAHIDSVISLAWSSDGGLLATGGRDSQVIVWDSTTWNTSYTIRSLDGPMTSLSWSPDGRRLLGCFERIVHLWDAMTGDEVFRLDPNLTVHTSPTEPGQRPNAPRFQTITNVRFSPDGKQIAALIGGRLVTWDASESFDRLSKSPFTPIEIAEPNDRAPSILPPVKLKRIERNP